MARRKKNLSLDEQIQAIDAEIAKKEEEIVTLKEQRAQLENEKKQKDVEELYELMKKAGKSVEDIKELLN